MILSDRSENPGQLANHENVKMQNRTTLSTPVKHFNYEMGTSALNDFSESHGPLTRGRPGKS